MHVIESGKPAPDALVTTPQFRAVGKGQEMHALPIGLQAKPPTTQLKRSLLLKAIFHGY